MTLPEPITSPMTRNPPSEDHLPLHSLEFAILLVLGDGPAHGYRIVKEVEADDESGRQIYPANLYRRIRDLNRRGLLEDCAPPADADQEGGPTRKYFRLTPLGREVSRAEAIRLHSLVETDRVRRLLHQG